MNARNDTPTINMNGQHCPYSSPIDTASTKGSQILNNSKHYSKSNKKLTVLQLLRNKVFSLVILCFPYEGVETLL